MDNNNTSIRTTDLVDNCKVENISIHIELSSREEGYYINTKK